MSPEKYYMNIQSIPKVILSLVGVVPKVSKESANLQKKQEVCPHFSLSRTLCEALPACLYWGDVKCVKAESVRLKDPLGDLKSDEVKDSLQTDFDEAMETKCFGTAGISQCGENIESKRQALGVLLDSLAADQLSSFLEGLQAGDYTAEELTRILSQPVALQALFDKDMSDPACEKTVKVYLKTVAENIASLERKEIIDGLAFSLRSSSSIPSISREDAFQFLMYDSNFTYEEKLNFAWAKFKRDIGKSMAFLALLVLAKSNQEFVGNVVRSLALDARAAIVFLNELEHGFMRRPPVVDADPFLQEARQRGLQLRVLFDNQVGGFQNNLEMLRDHPVVANIVPEYLSFIAQHDVFELDVSELNLGQLN